MDRRGFRRRLDGALTVSINRMVRPASFERPQGQDLAEGCAERTEVDGGTVEPTHQEPVT